MGKNYLCNFAKGDLYKKCQIYQRGFLAPYYEGIFEYDDQFVIDSGFYGRNKYVFEHSETGFGECSWKPYIILDSLSKIEYGDSLTYLDVTDRVQNEMFFSWLQWNIIERLNSRFFNINYYKHSNWTTMDCYIGMGCNYPEYHNIRQLEAGTLAFVKTDENINFLHEWMSWCCLPEIICRNMNYYGKPNLPGFQSHRGDQSILTNLFHRYGFVGEYNENVRMLIAYNWFSDHPIPEEEKATNEISN
jgi:hypothetical protein